MILGLVSPYIYSILNDLPMDPTDIEAKEIILAKVFRCTQPNRSRCETSQPTDK